MIKLKQDQLSKIPFGCLRPGYNRKFVRAGIAHIGVGGFHRAHLAVYLERCLAAEGHEEWGLCGINLMPQDGTFAKAMKQQDGLYSVTEMSANGNHTTRVIGAMVEYYYGPDNPEDVLKRLSSPDIKIVSLTITEGGYLIDEKGRFKLEHPSIVHDLKNPHQPTTAFGYIVEALARRQKAGIPAFTILSCDNLQHNGNQARNACVSFAKARDPKLAEWIDCEAGFPNAMVDRITPATDLETKNKLRELTGINDEAPVICEDFIQWVIEDDFPLGRPKWESVGAIFTDDVTPYENAKIRLLNGSHLMLAYPAFLKGYRKVDEAMRDPIFFDYLRTFLDRDASPDLRSLPGLDLESYKKTILNRFSNRAIGDQLARLCSDGASKFPKFILPTLQNCLEKGRSIDRIAFKLASYERYLHGIDEKGASYPINEPNAGHLLNKVITSKSPMTLLEIKEIVGSDLPKHKEFVQKYLEYSRSIQEVGIVKTLGKILKSNEIVTV